MKQLWRNIVIVIVGILVPFILGASFKSPGGDDSYQLIAFSVILLVTLWLAIDNYRYQKNPINTHRTLSYWFMIVAILLFGFFGIWTYLFLGFRNFPSF